MSRKQLTKAVAYFRTSSATNVGPDKDSLNRQRAAVVTFAKSAGYEIVEEFYDAAVSGADAIDERGLVQVTTDDNPDQDRCCPTRRQSKEIHRQPRRE